MPSWAQYSGYINIQSQGGVTKSLFYWFVESQNNPATDPVIFFPYFLVDYIYKYPFFRLFCGCKEVQVAQA